MLRKLLWLSGFEGATVMTAELCGAKLLAPLFGSSLYVWSSVMGITLLALASGYFFGALLSQKPGAQRNRLSALLLTASFFVSLMPLTGSYVLPGLMFWPLLTGVVAGTLLVLFVPVFLLGASSPLFISLQSVDPGTAGKMSGYVYAISTLGGIVSTFLCGFYLIPELGIKLTLLLFASILLFATMFLLGVPFFRALPIILFSGCTVLLLQKECKSCMYHSEGILGEIKVFDKNDSSGKIRILTVNDIIQSEMRLKDRSSASAYVGLIDKLVPLSGKQSHALVLGLGAGLTSNLLIRKGYSVDAVELDARIISSARNYFGLSEKVQVFTDDARRFLNTNKKSYHIVLVDVFKAEEQPSHVITSESLRALKSDLHKGARILINWHGYSHGKLGEGTTVMLNTLKSSGYFTKCCTNSVQEDHRNIIIMASLEPLPFLPNEIEIDTKITDHENSDNFQILEKANALANKRWRSLYMEYYRKNGLN
ncbi:MAG TPA: fused MFS/spermidine synthase [Bacteroidia bacterium]|nr:fused MFS/spermidine synthase [Bacteroidia bacterium]